MIRTFGIALAASSFLIAPAQAQTANAQGQAHAQTGFELAQARSANDVIVQLRDAGFTINAVTRTFLGRVRIEASNDTTVREVVVSRSTGEILSDRVNTRAEASGGASGNASGGPSATGTTASGGIAGGNATGSAETGVTASGGIAGGAVSGSASVGATASGGIGGGNGNASGNGNAGGNSGADVGVSVGGGLR